MFVIILNIIDISNNQNYRITKFLHFIENHLQRAKSNTITNSVKQQFPTHIQVMNEIGLSGVHATAKGLRHAF